MSLITFQKPGELRRPAAFIALYPHSVVRVQMPVLRFQFPSGQSDLAEPPDIDALLLDCKPSCPEFGVAGGNRFIWRRMPSLFQAASIERLLSGVRALAPLQPQAEITLKPTVCPKRKVSRLLKMPASPACLSACKASTIRRCKRSAASTAAMKGGCDRCGAGIVLAGKHRFDVRLPAPPKYGIRRGKMCTALATGAGHISAYHLTMSPNTPFGHTPPSGLPHDDAAQEIEDAVRTKPWPMRALPTMKLLPLPALAKAVPPQPQLLAVWRLSRQLRRRPRQNLAPHPTSSAPPAAAAPNDYLAAMQGKAGRGRSSARRIAAEDLAFRIYDERITPARRRARCPAARAHRHRARPHCRADQAAQQKGLLDQDPLSFSRMNTATRF